MNGIQKIIGFLVKKVVLLVTLDYNKNEVNSEKQMNNKVFECKEF